MCAFLLAISRLHLRSHLRHFHVLVSACTFSLMSPLACGIPYRMTSHRWGCLARNLHLSTSKMPKKGCVVKLTMPQQEHLIDQVEQHPLLYHVPFFFSKCRAPRICGIFFRQPIIGTVSAPSECDCFAVSLDTIVATSAPCS